MQPTHPQVVKRVRRERACNLNQIPYARVDLISLDCISLGVSFCQYMHLKTSWVKIMFGLNCKTGLPYSWQFALETQMCPADVSHSEFRDSLTTWSITHVAMCSSNIDAQLELVPTSRSLSAHPSQITQCQLLHITLIYHVETRLEHICYLARIILHVHTIHLSDCERQITLPTIHFWSA